MSRNQSFQPAWASAPGETIADILKHKHLPLQVFAERMGRSIQTVSDLLAGHLPITIDVAIQLEEVLGGTAAFWMNRETQYRDDVGRLEAEFECTTRKKWLHEIPLRDMIKFQWVQHFSDRDKQAAECLRFFDVSSVCEWREKYRALSNVVAFRTSTSFTSHPGAIAAWFRQGEIEGLTISCNAWNPNRFRDSLLELRMLTRKKEPSVFLPELKKCCAACGVAVVIVRAPTGCRASGATRFIAPDKALLLLSFRYRTDDQFWFTFFHESGHLLIHSKSALFIEGTDMLSTFEEEEANRFSADTLIPTAFQEELITLGTNYRQVMRFARRIGISPGIVVGQLQHYGILTRNQLNYLKIRYTWEKV